MKREPPTLDLGSLDATPARLRHLAAHLQLSEVAYEHALRAAGLLPDPAAWRRLMRGILLIYGAALVIAGIAAFFAYNWADLHKFAKFGLIQVGMATAVWLAWRKGLDSPAGRCALFGAAFLTGVLLAVYGQVYQTGADPYGLFLAWGLLIAGWAAIGRQPALWLLLTALANLSLVLYWEQVLYPNQGMGEFSRLLGPLAWLIWMLTDPRLAQWLFVLNASVLVTWEFFAARGVAWMQGRWLPRLLATIALATVVSTTLSVIFSSLAEIGFAHYAAPVWYTLFSLASLCYYRNRRHDLFILAACLLGVIVVITATFTRLSGGGYDIALLLSLLVISQTAGATVWLRQVAQGWKTAQ